MRTGLRIGTALAMIATAGSAHAAPGQNYYMRERIVGMPVTSTPTPPATPTPTPTPTQSGTWVASTAPTDACYEGKQTTSTTYSCKASDGSAATCSTAQPATTTSTQNCATTCSGLSQNSGIYSFNNAEINTQSMTPSSSTLAARVAEVQQFCDSAIPAARARRKRACTYDVSANKGYVWFSYYQSTEIQTSYNTSQWYASCLP